MSYFDPTHIIYLSLSRPFITGSTFCSRDDNTGRYHNDGAFAGLFAFTKHLISQSDDDHQLFRPDMYHHSLKLPWSFDLLSNGLNILLGHDRAVHYWKEGLRKGV